MKLKPRAVVPGVGASFDAPLLWAVILLVVVGTLMVFSSSVLMADTRFKAPYAFVTKQFIWAAIGSVALMGAMRWDYRALQKLARPLLIVAVVLLIVVLVIGTVKGGAKRWLRFGLLSFQPSELAKVALIVGLADYIDRRKSKLVKLKGLLPPLAMLAVLCVPIGMEPDLGTPALMTVVALCVLYAGGARLRHLSLAIPVIISVGVAEIIRKPYRLARMRDYLASWGDISAASYQIGQSLLAFGNGGFFGVGLGHGVMKRNFLPEPHTDFIFPVIGEELGFLGAIFVIGLLVVFVWRGMKIARSCPSLFGQMLALGITWTIAFQAAVNLGVATGVFPAKGLPLPFVSFGGTSLLINMALAGILLSISRRPR